MATTKPLSNKWITNLSKSSDINYFTGRCRNVIARMQNTRRKDKQGYKKRGMSLSIFKIVE